MIIKIFSDFCDCKKAKDYIETYCRTKNIKYYGTRINITEDDNYTHVIILNKAMPIINSNIPKENVIGLAWEPPIFLSLTEEFINYAKKNIGKYFIGDKGNLPEPFVESYSYMWYSRPVISNQLKNESVSISISFKKWTPMQKYRHLLVENILSNNLPINIYGNGSEMYLNKYINDRRIKGKYNNWTEPYERHLFSICIENFQTKHYFSEKIINPLMCKCTPIYIGCSTIKDYVDDTIINLTGNIVDDMNLLVNILKEPLKYYKNINPEIIDNKLNLIKNIDNIF